MEQSNSGMMGHGMPAEIYDGEAKRKPIKKTEKAHNGTQFQNSKIESIFKLVRLPDQKVHIVIGNNLVSRKSFKTYKQADEYIAEKPYELLINICCLILNSQKNEIKETKENLQSSEADK